MQVDFMRWSAELGGGEVGVELRQPVGIDQELAVLALGGRHLGVG